MGCCFSRPAGPNSPWPGGAPDANASARPINRTNTLNPPDDSHQQQTCESTQQRQEQEQLQQTQSQDQQQQSSPRRHRREPRPLDQHIDKPLRRHTWASKERTWTKLQLSRERLDFFDTRVTGRPEIWQTIHAALQVLWSPDEQTDDGTGGLSMAQTILSAAEISLPTGNLANGVYDSLGNYYPIPEWIVCDPTNVVDDFNSKGDASAGAGDTTGEDDIDQDSETGREEKGKGVIDIREQVMLRARLSENGRDYCVPVTKKEVVRSVARKIAQEAELAPTQRVRIAYMGKILKERSTLEAQNWEQDHVVNALVFAKELP